MYELWAKKKAIDGYGQKFEYITSFNNEIEKYYWCDTLDANIYEEAIVVRDNRLIFYKEFEIFKPCKVKKREKV